MNSVVYFLLIFFMGGPIWAFPENVRHGYFTCTSCHVSPSGGGVLTPYGRSLSAELMSTWGTTKVSGFLFSDQEDEERNPPWFRAQGLLRGVQTYRNTPAIEKALWIPMQADLEGGYDSEKFAIIGTLGYHAKKGSTDLVEAFSRRHYILYRWNDNWVNRAGKFMFSFGLNEPDHITATRRGLGWDQGSETYNFETSYLGDSHSETLTFISSSPELDNVKRDTALALNTGFFAFKNSRIGFSLYGGEQITSKRIVYGLYWILSLTEKAYLSSEVFIQNRQDKIRLEKKNGYATFHRLGYEITKGLFPYIQADRSFLDTTDKSAKLDSYGLGIQWLPFPHFEVMGFVGKEQTAENDPTDFAWLIFNFYI